MHIFSDRKPIFERIDIVRTANPGFYFTEIVKSEHSIFIFVCFQPLCHNILNVINHCHFEKTKVYILEVMCSSAHNMYTFFLAYCF